MTDFADNITGVASVILGSTIDRVEAHDKEGVKMLSLHLSQPTNQGEWIVELKIEPDGHQGLLVHCPEMEWQRT